MSLPTQPGAYRDCYDLFNLALSAPAGYCAPIDYDENTARHFQLRMNQARRVLRDQSRRIYPSDHHLYDVSEYDGLQVRLKQHPNGIWWVYVEPHGIPHMLEFARPIEAFPHPDQPLELTHAPNPEVGPSDLD